MNFTLYVVNSRLFAEYNGAETRDNGSFRGYSVKCKCTRKYNNYIIKAIKLSNIKEYFLKFGCT